MGNLFKILPKIIEVATIVVPLVEKLLKGASGKEKKDAAIGMIKPVIVGVEAGVGKDLVDEDLITSAAGNAVDGVVTILNESIGKNWLE